MMVSCFNFNIAVSTYRTWVLFGAINKCLQLLNNQQLKSMKIQMSALACLRLSTQFPTYLIYPSKKQAMQTIKQHLDDKKRLVRREAVACSNAWHLLMSS